MSEIIEIKYSNQSIKYGFIECGELSIKGNQWAWVSKEKYDKFYISNDPDFKNDICLFDYFEDVLNPTETELSLLELEHGIRYIKD